jgi:hypothetical protein
MAYHFNERVNRNCKRIIDKLRDSPMTIAELSSDLRMYGYDVVVAAGELSTQGHVVRGADYKFRLTRGEKV